MYGRHAVLAALSNSRRNVRKIYCSTNFFNKYSSKLRNFFYEIQSNDFLSQKIGKNRLHQGVIALVESIFSYNKNLMVDGLCSKIIILDQIQDSHNIGSIIRSAVAFGARCFILTTYNSPSENGDIDKAASGYIECTKVFLVTNLNNVIDRLKKLGFWIVGLDARSDKNIDSIPVLEKVAIVIGSEARGVKKLVLHNCDFVVKIPIDTSVESLNAANAAAIAFYSIL